MIRLKYRVFQINISPAFKVTPTAATLYNPIFQISLQSAPPPPPLNGLAIENRH